MTNTDDKYKVVRNGDVYNITRLFEPRFSAKFTYKPNFKESELYDIHWFDEATDSLKLTTLKKAKRYFLVYRNNSRAVSSNYRAYTSPQGDIIVERLVYPKVIMEYERGDDGIFYGVLNGLHDLNELASEMTYYKFLRVLKQICRESDIKFKVYLASFKKR